MSQIQTTSIMQKLLLIFLGFSLSACASVESESAKHKSSNVQALGQGMVVTANPLASQAGSDVLRVGGSAVDAAIAIQAVLSLVEPQSSGLGGGGFMAYFNNKTKQVTVYDGRETAPASINDTQFLDDKGQSIGYLNAKHSGLSTGVPGMVSMLQLAHADHGSLPWGGHFSAARELAESGFAVSARLNYFINRFGKYLPKTLEEGPIDAYEYFYDETGAPLAVGSILTNPDYAKTLDVLAEDPDAFYSGFIAEQIIAQTSASPRAGALSLKDMSAFKAQKRSALCSPFKGKQVCGPPPPSSWLAVGEIMGLVEAGNDFDSKGSDSPNNWVKFAEAQRLAYADRDQFVGDASFVDVPVSGMLSPAYWRLRVNGAGAEKATRALRAGDPWAHEDTQKVAYGLDSTVDIAGTTHFVVVDLEGNVVSMTSSVESIFGSARMAGGMFLNNQLTDFSFKPFDDTGKPIANRIEAGKRPRSSMSPTIVLDENGEFMMASGSPGGNSIIAYTAKTLIGVLEWGLTPQQAVELPNMVARGEKVRIEKSRASAELITGLKDYGFNVHESSGENSGLSVVLRNANGVLEGGVDSRREGTVEVVDAESLRK